MAKTKRQNLLFIMFGPESGPHFTIQSETPDGVTLLLNEGEWRYTGENEKYKIGGCICRRFQSGTPFTVIDRLNPAHVLAALNEAPGAVLG